MTAFEPDPEPDYTPVNRALDELARGHIPAPADLAALRGEIDRLRADNHRLRTLIPPPVQATVGGKTWAEATVKE